MRPKNQNIRLLDYNIAQNASGQYEMDTSVAPYQHVPQPGQVSRLADNWDETKAVCLVVNHRKDGTKTIVDGQNRTLAMLSLGITEWAAEVYTGLTVEQEADLYVGLNKDRRRVMTYDIWTAQRTGKVPEVLAAETALSVYGLSMGPKVGPMTVAAPKVVLDLLDRGELTDVLDVVKHWSFDVRALEGAMLGGYGRFMRDYPHNLAKLTHPAAHPQAVHNWAMTRRVHNTMLKSKDVVDAILRLTA